MTKDGCGWGGGKGGPEQGAAGGLAGGRGLRSFFVSDAEPFLAVAAGVAPRQPRGEGAAALPPPSPTPRVAEEGPGGPGWGGGGRTSAGGPGKVWREEGAWICLGAGGGGGSVPGVCGGSWGRGAAGGGRAHELLPSRVSPPERGRAWGGGLIQRVAHVPGFASRAELKVCRPPARESPGRGWGVTLPGDASASRGCAPFPPVPPGGTKTAGWGAGAGSAFKIRDQREAGEVAGLLSSYRVPPPAS